MELWDILDNDRNLTGKTSERGMALNKGEYHLVVFGFIKNSKGEFIISKRTANKSFPNTWEITGGAAITGDDSYHAIRREVKEELGIELTSPGKLIDSKKYEDDASYFVDVWLFEEDVDIHSVVCQPEEVSEAKLVTKDEIYKLINEGEFMMGIQSLVDCLDIV